MQKMKVGKQNTVKTARKPYRFIRTLAVAIVPVYILATIVSSYAEDPSAAIIIGFRGNGLNLRRGTNRNVTPVRAAGQRLQNSNDVLYIDGDGRSTARFAFAVGQIWEYGGLRVQTNPRNQPSEYRFPCRGRGNFTISWRALGETQDRACLPGIALGRRRRNLNSQLPLSNPWNLFQTAKNIFKAQTEDDEEVVVVPSQGRTIIETKDTGNDVLVDVAEGNVLVKSDKNPAGKSVRAGERYSYSQDRVTPIDRNALLNSPSMQEFLNPNNWSSPDVPKRVADEIAKEVEGDRTALGQRSPSVASNPRIPANDSSTTSSPRTSNNLSGEWVFDFGWVVFDPSNISGTCRTQPERGAYQGRITLTQNGNQLSVSAPPEVPMVSAAVSGNQFEAGGPIIQWRGIVSSDGNKITGTGTCGSASLPFTMTRRNSQSSNTSIKPEQYSLSGTWIVRATSFTGIPGKGCSAGYSGRLTVDDQDAAPGYEGVIIQQGNQIITPTQNISSSGGSYTQSSNGTVSGNLVTMTSSGGGFTIRLTGTISNDGNTVTGQSICQFSPGSATATGSFTWTRKK